MKYRSFGDEGGQVIVQLRGMLLHLGVTHTPEYIIKRVPRPGRDVFIAKVDIYDHHRILSTHYIPTPRLTSIEAMAVVAWEAMTYLSFVYRHHLAGSIYSLLPRRKRGHGGNKITTSPGGKA